MISKAKIVNYKLKEKKHVCMHYYRYVPSFECVADTLNVPLNSNSLINPFLEKNKIKNLLLDLNHCHERESGVDANNLERGEWFLSSYYISLTLLYL